MGAGANISMESGAICEALVFTAIAFCIHEKARFLQSDNIAELNESNPFPSIIVQTAHPCPTFLRISYHRPQHPALACGRGGHSTWTSTRSSVPERRRRDCCIRQGGCPNLPRSTHCRCPRGYRWSRHARWRRRGRRSGRKGPC